MNNRFLIVLFVSILFSIHSYGQKKWWENHFIFGMMLNPPMLDDDSAKNSYDEAIAAGFNLFTGDYIKHNNINTAYLESIYNYIKSIYNNLGYYFFAPRYSTKEAIINNYNGKFFKDEPEINDFESLKYLINDKKYSDKLKYINLYPYYKYRSWNEFQRYLDLYCDSIKTQVVSYDNYYQHSLFSDSQPSCNGRLYYSNLAEMRRRAGNRPLWCWVNTTEWVTKKDRLWQEAYLRLGCFAPVAYGAKGILSYTYDCSDMLKILRIENYHTKTVSQQNTPLFYNLPKDNIDNHHVFFGYFLDADTTSMVVYTDENKGTWRFKSMSKSSLNKKEWNCIYNEINFTDSISIPFIVTDSTMDKIATLTKDSVFVSSNRKSWDCKRKLWKFNKNIFNKLSTKKIASGNFDDNKGYDLCIAWNNTIRVYYNIDIAVGSIAKDYKDTIMDTQIFQVMSYCNNLYSIGKKSTDNTLHLYKYNKATNRWNTIVINDNNSVDIDSVDHFWIEEQNDTILLFMQINKGEIFYWNICEGSISCEKLNMKIKKYNSIGFRNKKNKCNDLYYIPRTEEFYSGILDTRQDTTQRYNIISKINKYIKNHLSDIVFNCEWKGCYHASYPPDGDSIQVKTISESDFITSLSEPLMAGVFEHEDSVYLLVVNRSDTLIQKPSICMVGRKYVVEEMLPRIDKDKTSVFEQKFDSVYWSTEVTWSNMTGGECIVLRLRKLPDYFQTHRNSYFDEDNCADINHRFKNGKWCIDYAENNFGQFDTFYTGYGNDDYSVVTCADYDGDGQTDLSVMTLNEGNQKLYIDYSENLFGKWNKEINLESNIIAKVTYIGLFNNDSISDFGYIDDNNGRLYIRYAPFSSNPNSYVGPYGNSTNTRPAIGDYDGDGHDEIAIYNFTNNISRLLIDTDYNPDYPSTFHWDVDVQMLNIPVADRASIQPVVADYDGDGKADFAYYNPNDSTWVIFCACNGFAREDYINKVYCSVNSNSNVRAVATDYDGDGLADMSLYIYNDDSLTVDIWYSKEAYKNRKSYSYSTSS